MKRAELVSLIAETYNRKLKEISSNVAEPHKPQYGAIVKPSKDGDPLILVIGAGKQRLSQAKTQVNNLVREVAKKAIAGDYVGLISLINSTSTLFSYVNAIVEVEKEMSGGITEVTLGAMNNGSSPLGKTQSGQATSSDPNQTPAERSKAERNAKELSAAEKEQANLKGKVEKINGEESKLITPIKPKLAQLDRERYPLEKKLGAAAGKVDKFQQENPTQL